MLEKKSFYINGSWVDPKKQKDIEVINPATEKVCAVISSGSKADVNDACLLYTSPSPRDGLLSRMPSSA